jgi:hypothetical protein
MKTQTVENPVVYAPPGDFLETLPTDALIAPSATYEGIVKSVSPGSDLSLPGYLTHHEFTAPSLDVTTFRGNEAAVVPLFQTDARLDTMYHKATKGREGRVERMQYEMLVRILDTSGADGLHHMHSRDTNFPRTIFYNVRPGSGLQLYMTSVGETEDGRPIFGVLTATNGPKDERDFLKVVGRLGSSMKGRG